MSSKYTGSPKTLGLASPEKLTPSHNLNEFDCLDDTINDYLRSAHKQSASNNAVVYVVCEAGTNIVRGYYTLSNGSVDRDEAPSKVKRNSPTQIPVTLIGRLGIDQKYQGRGAGSELLRDAIERCIFASTQIGSRAILVHAINSKVVPFYKNFGFRESAIAPFTLFLSLI